MSFVLTRPPSPRADMHHSEEDSLVTALNSALQSFTGAQHGSHTPHEHDMHRDRADKNAPYLDIVVNSDTLTLRGTGVDVDPALLSGNLVLYLSEPTSLKEIVLQFRGKARLPVSASEPLSLSSNQLTYLVCNHEWSFLEGNRSHAHTLKAGRHLFPFQLQIGGSLPSSISTTALGGASVQYKLRATAVRPGFGITHRDLTALHPIQIVRGFGPEALEYQQTLEIENTWPEKLMYSIMIPHKAWVAGEKVTAVVKFSPLVKGARVLNVTTTINEAVKLNARSGIQESTRVISSTRHDIVDGEAVCTDEQHHRYRIPLLHHHAHTTRHSTSASPHTVHGPAATNGHSSTTLPSGSPAPSPQRNSAEFTPLTTTTTNSSQSSGVGSSRPPRPSSSAGTSHPSSESESTSTLPVSLPPPPQSPISLETTEADLIEHSVDVVTTLNITVPAHATPSHGLEASFPIQVSHRIRWSILIGNSDGHTSELRCSLPLHVLDHRLYEEARAATLHTRRILLGPQDVEGGQAIGTHGEDDAEEDMDLPSYPSHVRDRVANAYIPDSAVMRVVNPWVLQGISPTMALAQSEHSSGMQSPAVLETWQVPHGSVPPSGSVHSNRHLPHDPAPGAAPLEWVNTELLLSLRGEPMAPEASAQQPPPRTTPPSRTPPESSPASRHGSRFPSRRQSRANSRAASPERGSPTVLSSSGGMHGPHGHGETYVHSHSTASRNMHSLFNIAMKPFTSLSNTFSLSSRSTSHTNLHGHGHSHSQSGVSTAIGSPSANASMVNLNGVVHPSQPSAMTSPQRLHYAFTEVPDYDMASRGFLGGGITPLSSMRGLPSYEDAAAMRTAERGSGFSAAERSFSDTDLAGMFLTVQRQRRAQPPVPRTVASTPPPPMSSPQLPQGAASVSLTSPIASS
ncbi:uncharacterized protein FIBRA_05326 [Fibroporia radiculosa]|uniref:Arrestin C-terminal-like domain-containing protein n=1 Tax=Fibroporia radiculosa TaxID=599839 RepID=J4HXB7_9APHY|nr:uncharacterized protein FIBRA_05326 [Fibroporia radiculosa]CCM03202.1 predicted protein [Fibroporia radiculosa]